MTIKPMRFEVERGWVEFSETPSGSLMVSFEPYDGPSWSQEGSEIPDFIREAVIDGDEEAARWWVGLQPFGKPRD